MKREADCLLLMMLVVFGFRNSLTKKCECSLLLEESVGDACRIFVGVPPID